jgi:hypothetical protein
MASLLGRRVTPPLVTACALVAIASCGGAKAGNTAGSAGATGAAGAGQGSGGMAGAGTTGAGTGGAAGGNGGMAGAMSPAGAGGTAGIPAGLLNPSTTTTWNPGILADSQLKLPLGPDGLPVRGTVCANPKPGDDLNAAIAACPEGQVVKLSAATYMVSSTVVLTKGVVLRGAGSQGAAAGGTTIVRAGGGSVLAIGKSQDGACYSGAFGTAYPLTSNALKETNVVTLGANAVNFAAGDIALLDQVDDPTVQEGDCQYFKRVDKRSIEDRVEIASVDAGSGTLTLSTPLHFTFKVNAPYAAQMAKATGPIVRWAGIETLAIQGGSNPGYDGQQAGGIDISNAAYSWVKDVQTDGTIGGMHVTLSGTYRCVVRDSHFHNSANYGFGADCYGVVLRCGSADDLIENNVVRYMNKPILFNVAGSGNVVAYNYADNSWATPPAWQEVNIDVHCSFPHMELMEGNFAPHMGATITHGNAGYMTYFRNYASSQFAPPAVFGSTDAQTGNVTALQFDAGDLDMTVIGNVLGSAMSTSLGTAPVSSTFIGTGSDTPSIFEVGSGNGGLGMNDVAFKSLWLHGNFDTVNGSVQWNPSIQTHALPASLYLKAKPAWWPAGSPWPWAGPDLTPMVGKLPAKVRSDALGN